MAPTTGAERAKLRMEIKALADGLRLAQAEPEAVTRQQRRATARAAAKGEARARRAAGRRKRAAMLIPKPLRQPKAHAYRTVLTGELRNGRERYLHYTKGYGWRVA